MTMGVSLPPVERTESGRTSLDATATDGEGAINLEGVSKTYPRGPVQVRAISDLSVQIDPGEFVVLLGPSGSGKTTLLNLLGAIEPPSAGRIEVSGVDVSALEGSALTHYRRTQVGFVFQFFNLVPTLTASENVEVVAELIGPGASERSRAALDLVGLADRLDHFPAQLSGGEQQRVAVARALVKDAPLVLGDEPTGSLDLETGKQILGLFRQAASAGRTILVVTHNSAIASMADRVLELRDGRLVNDRRIAMPLTVGEVSW
jgi:putative ABC transport system ATP-binding protein